MWEHQNCDKTKAINVSKLFSKCEIDTHLKRAQILSEIWKQGFLWLQHQILPLDEMTFPFISNAFILTENSTYVTICSYLRTVYSFRNMSKICVCVCVCVCVCTIPLK